MRSRNALAAAWLGVVAFSATAQAADPSSFPVLSEMAPPPMAATEFVSGWYLRGDIGYRKNRVGSVEAIAPVVAVGENIAIDNTVALGLGAGYKWKFFRADATFDYIQNRRMYNAMLNGYLDMGTWAGFTPYIGAGVGTSYLSSSDFKNALADPTSIGESSAWSFSWAWMVGVSYQVAHNLAVDVGFRYLNYGKSFTGNAMLTQNPPNPVGDPVRFNGLSAQEFRIGVRLAID